MSWRRRSSLAALTPIVWRVPSTSRPVTCGGDDFGRLHDQADGLNGLDVLVLAGGNFTAIGAKDVDVVDVRVRSSTESAAWVIRSEKKPFNCSS